MTNKTTKTTPFKFKQFSIAHDLCAMKIGVDGVLLGAWAHYEKPKRILDVGTGSGLIAMMLRQRFPSAEIVAIDPNEKAFLQAKGNFENSPFEKGIELENSTLQDFQSDEKFDIIVSNPPFYQATVSSSDEDRDQARQAKFLPINEMVKSCVNLLNEEGEFQFIYPADSITEIEDILAKNDLFITQITQVIPTQGKPVKRLLIAVSKTNTESSRNNITIEISRGYYTDEYKNLTKKFYLNF